MSAQFPQLVAPVLSRPSNNYSTVTPIKRDALAILRQSMKASELNVHGKSVQLYGNKIKRRDKDLSFTSHLIFPLVS